MVVRRDDLNGPEMAPPAAGRRKGQHSVFGLAESSIGRVLRGLSRTRRVPFIRAVRAVQSRQALPLFYLDTHGVDPSDRSPERSPFEFREWGDLARSRPDLRHRPTPDRGHGGLAALGAIFAPGEPTGVGFADLALSRRICRGGHLGRVPGPSVDLDHHGRRHRGRGRRRRPARHRRRRPRCGDHRRPHVPPTAPRGGDRRTFGAGVAPSP